MSIKKTKSADVHFGDKDIFKEDDFKSSQIGHRISIVIPEDVLMHFREMAQESGSRYQTLINQILRQIAFSGKVTTIEQRLKKIESIVFKKKRNLG
ncbi:MAG TPA: BrnA antitoxin family protein [Bdellovibrionota bacterium]|nr:BrnA antitoxin family protein [Bdellovibrionota bacterium]